MVGQILIKTLSVCITMLFICFSIIFAQPDTLWTKTFGDIKWDLGNDLQQTSDEGYIITGYTDSFVQGGAFVPRVCLIKTDSLGDSLWAKTFVGKRGNSVQQTSDGGYIIAGVGGGGWGGILLIKTDDSGNKVWSKILGGKYDDVGYSVQQTFDGGYIVTGYTVDGAQDPEWAWSDIWLFKTDESGDALWTKTFGGEYSEDFGFSVQQTSDGGYIVTGFTYTDNICLIKTDESGDALWTKAFGGSGRSWGYSVQQTSDGGYIVTGFTESYGAGDSDIWLIKTDVSGDTLWTKTFGGKYDDQGYSVKQTFDGGYIVTGFTESYGAGDSDIWLIRTDVSGDTLWTKTFGGRYNDKGRSVQQTSDGGYIVTGFTESYGAGKADIWLIRIAPDLPSVTIGDNPKFYPSSFCLHQNHPNPFNPVTTIRYDLPEQSQVSLMIYDILGREIRTLINTTQNAGYKSVLWDGTDEFGRSVGTGIYLYQIKAQQPSRVGQAGDFSQTKKMLLLK